MISNFPIPYPDELIYSVIARYAIHNGILSPKYLTEELFNNRNLTPTYDLPSHIGKLASYLPDCYDALYLINHHTLLPIYQPFQPDTVMRYAVHVLQGEQYQSLHTKLGKNASRIKSVNFFRFCPHCWQEQMEQYGEVYWKRSWQITGYEYCIKHESALFVSSVPCNGLDRRFYNAHLNVLIDSSQLFINSQDLKRHLELAKIIEDLLIQSSHIAVQDVSILSNAYFNLLKDGGLLSGQKNINYEKIRHLVLDYWGESFLKYYHLDDLLSENCWLKNMCRKHRKAFSYLEHLIVLKALIPEQSPIYTYQQYLDLATVGIEEQAIPVTVKHKTYQVLSDDQLKWIQLIQDMSVKLARKHDGALYARLYRNHKDWLLQINQTAIMTPLSLPKPRVDWSIRDRQFMKQLIKIRDELLEDLDSPQWTKKFLIKQLGHVSLIEKNWHFLPLTKAFLERYAESVDCYQIRRLTRTYIRQQSKNKYYPSSVFLRKSGLSEQRLTPEAHRFFNNIWEEIRNE
ncbi:TnsD family Tn7-like transposition protein [Acinetobacter baumannii]|uniref:TnsD family Tn7-like transposition protein n=1 Tax=Acinetobacter baumannii TaxID=470 RepID=UPI000712F45A|nr:TnsD family Tn7-like transposition protein [Acinetobacter baumannii]KRI39179.1 transposase [Acinetobacter baumannii]MDQ8960275.1 TnsD family Tn7-like transposition protein [Acinetobacter baumannii]